MCPIYNDLQLQIEDKFSVFERKLKDMITWFHGVFTIEDDRAEIYKRKTLSEPDILIDGRDPEGILRDLQQYYQIPNHKDLVKKIQQAISSFKCPFTVASTLFFICCQILGVSYPSIQFISKFLLFLIS